MAGRYISDPHLVSRIKTYMNNITDDADDDFLDVDKVSGYLRAKYKEYARKKRNNFDSMVEKALELVMDEPLVYVGNKKSKSKKCGKNFAAELSIDSSDENLAQSGLKNLNSTNNMVTSLYDKPNTSSTTKLEARDDEEDTESVKLIESKKRKLNSSSQPGENSLKFSNRTRSNNKDILVLEHSSLTFSDIGGCEKQLLDICKMVMHLRHPDLYNKMGFKPPRGFLLHGPPGCGKTMLAYAIAGELDLPFIKVAATEMVSGVSGDSEQKIRELFAQAVAFAPCILFLDEIDSIASRRDNAQREMERRIVAQLLACLDDMEKSNHQVVVIGATTRPDSIDPALRRAGRFDKEIGLGMPDERCREKILEKICKDIRLESNFSMKNLSRLTPGYVGADLAALAREACVIAMNRVFETLFTSIVEEKVLSDLTLVETELERAKKWLKEKPPLNYDSIADLHVTMKDFVQALKYITPSAKREGFATVPDITWDDVGALASVRESLEWSILYPIKRPELFESLGLDIRPQGVLLCGPPGCGKTLIAKAVANESGMNFISVKGPELLSMYVGESERAVRQVFQRAINSSPCVIFFDELDALCPRRSDHESGGTARVVNQLLTEMDGVESRKSVFLIGATNRPDIIDPAIMRPGRLDKILYVGFPNVDDKVDILRAITKNRTKPLLDDDLSFESIAKDQRAEFFTGADLAALVHEAALVAVKRRMDGSGGDVSATENVVKVGKNHFDVAFSKVKPSVSNSERNNFLKLKRKYGDIDENCGVKIVDAEALE